MKVAIAWYGAEGQSSYKYFKDQGHDVTIVTPKVAEQFPIPEGAKAIVGDDAFDRLGDFDLVVRSANVRPGALQTNGKIWSQTNEFFEKCPATIVGVTGTKGKGTTCSFIAEILRASGQTVHLVGNIGVPPLDILPQIQQTDVVVYELSSFQLWDAEQSPHVAVVLMIEADHLDAHTDMDDYVGAKSQIARHQMESDVVIYHPTNAYSRQIAETSAGTKARFGVVEDGQVYVKSNTFFVRDTELCSVDAVQIPGVHNLENACAAISAALAVGADPARIDTGLRAFTGLPHRLKFVAEKAGVKYYDDSIATTAGSAIAAINAFDQPIVLVLGGSDKGISYDEVVELCRARKVSVVAIGQTGERIAELCRAAGVDVVRETGDMTAVVSAAARAATTGGVVVLSPASASFDQYKSYAERGDKFVAAVETL